MTATSTKNYITTQSGYIVEMTDGNKTKYLKIDGKLKVFGSKLCAQYACDSINLNNK